MVVIDSSPTTKILVAHSQDWWVFPIFYSVLSFPQGVTDPPFYVFGCPCHGGTRFYFLNSCAVRTRDKAIIARPSNCMGSRVIG